MKKTLRLWAALSFVLCMMRAGYALDIQADSRISQVTVYPDSALITRSASVRLAAGKNTVVFADIIPQIDEDSLRVSVQNNPEITLLGAQCKKEFLPEVPSEQEQQLKSQIQKCQDEMDGLQGLKQSLAEEKNFLDSVRMFSTGQLPKDLATRMPLAKDLDETLQLLDAKLKELFTAGQDAQIKERDLVKKLDALNRELAQISGSGQKVKRSIEVIVEASKAATVELAASFRVFNASWQPIYDARADFDGSEVELVSFGLVSQRTGEDWRDVQMSLSTAKPAIGGNLPYVAPWFITPYQPSAPLQERRVGYLARKAVSQTMAMDEELAAPAAAMTPPAKEKEPAARALDNGVAAVYALTNKVSVATDGAENKLPISTQKLAAKFKYSAYPRLSTYAYLGSRVTNAKELQLLGGKVNIFLSGDFVGSSSIEGIGPSEEFDLYLGIDENVKVKRQLIAKKTDDVLIAGIPAPTRKIAFTYKLTVENYKSKKVDAILFEAVPVSQDERIKVKVTDVNIQPKDKDWKDRKGIWRWELQLDPKQKVEIIYSYVVEFPRDMQVDGL